MKKKPRRPHSFWGDGRSAVAVAHRGGGYTYGSTKHKKENTLHAFSAVSRLGYRYIELDVIVTADNKVVVLHVAKNRLEAVARKKDAPSSRQLQNMKYAEMQRTLDRDVPTLKQILSKFPDTRFLIDAKSDEVLQPLAGVVNELKVMDRVCLGSFYPPRLHSLNQLLGDGACLRLIISRSPWHFYRQLQYLKKAQADYISAVDLPYLLLTRAMVNWAHRRSVRVLVWTPNSRWAISRCLDLDADGVISDRADLLKEVILKKNPKNSSFINHV